MSKSLESGPHSPNGAHSKTVPLGSCIHRPNAGLPTMTPEPLNPEAPQLPVETIGRYSISGEIARGGMGAVLRGHDPELGRDLAIKVLLDNGTDSEQVRRFIEEAQIGGQLQHPGIVPVYEIGVSKDSRPYFTMKLVEGRTLAKLLHQRVDPAHDLPRFLGIFQQVCQTMAYAHDRGVVHRDLKPGNIMVGAFGEVQVMDWGLAKILTRPADKAPAPAEHGREIRTVRSGQDGPSSVEGTVSGTPAYMAPEQARGENERVDARADVFALGSILCEILTGRPAYEGNASEDTYHRAWRSDLGDAQARLNGCGADPQLLVLARRCLEAEPEARPRDAGVVAQQVTAYFEGVQERLRRAEIERAAAEARAAGELRSRRLRRTLGGLIVVTLFGLALAVGWSFEKRARLRHEVESDLSLAEQSQADGKWAEARAAAERAGGRLSGSGPEELQDRLGRVRAALAHQQALDDMRDNLENIRLRQAEVIDGRFSRGEALVAYREAFQKFDLDVFALDPDDAARRLRESAIAEALLAALDDWLLVLSDAKRDDWRRLLDVVQMGDANAPRRALRAAWATGDAKALRDLARPKSVAELPPTTALFVSAVLRNTGAQEEALAILEAAQREHPADFWLNHRLAYWLDHFTSRQEEAVGYYRAALASRPKSPGVYVNLSVVLERLGRFDEAEDAGRKAIALKGEYAEAHANLAYFLRRRERLTESDEALQKALVLKPRLLSAQLNLFHLRDQQGRSDEAAAAIREALKSDPDNAAVHHDYGVFLLKAGRTATAKEEFERAADLEPANPVYHFQVAYALKRLGAMDQAEKEFRKGLALDGNAAHAHTNFGAILFDQGRYAEAEQEHRAAIEANPKLPVAHLNLGVTLAREGKFVEAEAAIHDALNQKADFGAAYYHLARTQLRQGKNEAAAVSFREALRMQCDDAEVHGYFAMALTRMGKHDEAEREFRLALDRRREAPEWKCRLGQVLCERGRFQEGCEWIRNGHEYALAHGGWDLPSAEWLKAAERGIELEKQLPAVLAGAAAPQDGAEWLEYARVCQAKKQYAGAVQCFESAFVAKPELATDYRHGGGRGNAARAAVRAASGQGVDVPDDAAKAHLRQQALTWLRADVAGWSRTLPMASASMRDHIHQSLETMQRDPALAAVRDEADLGKLPEAERTEFRQFWASVADLY